MPLPTEPTTPWPPIWWAPAANEIATATAWYEGDPDALAKLYDGAGGRQPIRPSERRITAPKVGGSFWSKTVVDGTTVRMHAPAASDIAMVAADMLFGEEPSLIIPEAHGDVALDDAGNPLPPTAEQQVAKDAEQRLAELVEQDGIATTLINGAEFASGLGGVYLRPMWDEEVADHAMLTLVQHDHAVPEFKWGKLVAVTFWSVVERTSSGQVWRHLERYERGIVLHGLYLGSEREIGSRIDLRNHAATAPLATASGATDDGSIIMPGLLSTELVVRFIPNATNRARTPYGRSDTAGLEGEMAALDEAWSSWMRDVRLGKARVIVPDQFLDRAGKGAGATFDLDREVFSPLNVEPSAMTNAGIQLIQPDVRFEAHEATTTALFLAIARSAGYDPQSFGMEGDGGMATATEVRAKDARSNRTTGRKQRPWALGLGDSGYHLLCIEQAIFGWRGTPMRPTVQFVDPTEADIRERASTLNLVNLAVAASIAERVRILHPEWDEPRIAAEARAIAAETNVGMPVDDPTGGFDREPEDPAPDQ